MGQVTRIEWTATVNDDGSVTPGSTWNPTRGCSMAKGSELGGCLNCYAAAIASRFADDGPFKGFARRTENGPRWTGKVELVENHLTDPLHWSKPRKIFVNSMSDIFHEDLPDAAIDRVFAVMARCPQHTFQILTKRADRMRDWTASKKGHFSLEHQQNPAMSVSRILPLENVWLGVSVEDQQRADERIPLLLQTPAAIRFVSYEPALSAVNFGGWLYRQSTLTRGLDQIIIGAESGPGARPFNEDWARSTRDQCLAAGCAFFYKQSATTSGHKISTPELDGQKWMEFPTRIVR